MISIWTSPKLWKFWWGTFWLQSKMVQTLHQRGGPIESRLRERAYPRWPGHDAHASVPRLRGPSCWLGLRLSTVPTGLFQLGPVAQATEAHGPNGISGPKTETKHNSSLSTFQNSDRYYKYQYIFFSEKPFLLKKRFCTFFSEKPFLLKKRFWKVWLPSDGLISQRKSQIFNF